MHGKKTFNLGFKSILQGLIPWSPPIADSCDWVHEYTYVRNQLLVWEDAIYNSSMLVMFVCGIITSRVSGRGYKNGAVCLSVSTLTAEPFGVGSWNLVQGLTLIISLTSSTVKVKGRRSRSLGQKCDFQGFLIWVIRNPGYIMTSWHYVTSHKWRYDAIQCHV